MFSVCVSLRVRNFVESHSCLSREWGKGEAPPNPKRKYHYLQRTNGTPTKSKRRGRGGAKRIFPSLPLPKANIQYRRQSANNSSFPHLHHRGGEKPFGDGEWGGMETGSEMLVLGWGAPRRRFFDLFTIGFPAYFCYMIPIFEYVNSSVSHFFLPFRLRLGFQWGLLRRPLRPLRPLLAILPWGLQPERNVQVFELLTDCSNIPLIGLYRLRQVPDPHFGLGQRRRRRGRWLGRGEGNKAHVHALQLTRKVRKNLAKKNLRWGFLLRTTEAHKDAICLPVLPSTAWIPQWGKRGKGKEGTVVAPNPAFPHVHTHLRFQEKKIPSEKWGTHNPTQPKTDLAHPQWPLRCKPARKNATILRTFSYEIRLECCRKMKKETNLPNKSKFVCWNPYLCKMG